MLVPPANFGIAEEGVYRCSKVETLNLSFLETLNLKTVVFLGGQEPSKFFKDFFKSYNIKYHVIKNADFTTSEVTLSTETSAYNDDTSIKDSDQSTTEENELRENKYKLKDGDNLMLIRSSCLRETMRLILNAENYNTMLVDRTSIMIGMLRKLQKWNISSIINEYRFFAGKNANYFAETFLEIINLSIEQDLNDDSSELSQTLQNKLKLDNKTKPKKKVKIRKQFRYTRVIKEEDLLKEIEVPPRLLQLARDTEAMNQSNQLNQSSKDSQKLKSEQSSLGIFGNQYRLAFNRKERRDYEYYKLNKKNVDKSTVITVNIPIEEKLPHWFKTQRDIWEQKNVTEEHNFYAENIFV